ncbi:MAG: biotin/lipoyl-containing protein, partial [Burkholderiaceae bacterium]
MALVEVKVPDIGDFDEVTVIELLVKPGDTIAPEQSLITVESDKASMEIPSSHAGVIKELKVALGDKVKQGSIVLTIESAGDAQAPAAQQPVASASAPAPTPTPAPAAAPTPSAAAPAAEGVAQPAGGTFEIHVPDIGDFTDVAVIELLVNPGDTIKPEQSLITVESDKAAMEIPASSGGVLKELKVKIGDKVNQGDLLAILEGAGGAAAPVSAPASAPAPAAATTAAAAPQDSAAKAPSPQAVTAPGATKSEVPAHDPGTHRQGLPHASPSVRKFARELGVPLDE